MSIFIDKTNWHTFTCNDWSNVTAGGFTILSFWHWFYMKERRKYKAFYLQRENWRLWQLIWVDLHHWKHCCNIPNQPGAKASNRYDVFERRLIKLDWIISQLPITGFNVTLLKAGVSGWWYDFIQIPPYDLFDGQLSWGRHFIWKIIPLK